ncbi:MAG TPA: hypothetical protein VFJ29_05215, partial [Candidatus Kapabacteria bacterium]|nr:hypothetical protein [Candidatus Kapabacteria bacterium]
KLLETKHLYQHIDIDPLPLSGCLQEAFAEIEENKKYTGPNSLIYVFSKEYSEWKEKHGDEGKIFSVPWVGDTEWSLPPHMNNKPLIDSINFQLEGVTVYCSKCKQSMTFHLKHGKQFTYGLEYYRKGEIDSVVQDFILALECQKCRNTPETFLIRRKNLRLTLCGRVPMESVPVDKDIPESAAEYIPDAVVAFQSGKILAGLFYYRVFVEQFLRKRYDADSEKIDVLVSRYMEELPSDFKTRFPSMADIYSKLSEAIHKANKDEALYNKVHDEILEHFAARRLFKLK